MFSIMSEYEYILMACFNNKLYNEAIWLNLKLKQFDSNESEKCFKDDTIMIEYNKRKIDIFS